MELADFEDGLSQGVPKVTVRIAAGEGSCHSGKRIPSKFRW